MRFSIIQLIYLVVAVPLGIISTRIKEIKSWKRIPSLYTDIEVSLNQNNNNKSYINDPACYNGTVEDLLSVCEYYLGNYKTSLKWSKKALKLDPENTRIINNKELISQKIY